MLYDTYITIGMAMNDYDEMILKLITKVKSLHLQLEETNNKLDQMDLVVHKIIILLGKRS